MVPRKPRSCLSRSFSATPFPYRRQSRRLFHRISTDILHSTHPRTSYYPIITTHHLFIVQPTLSSSSPFLFITRYVVLAYAYIHASLPVIWCCPSIVLSAIFSSSSVPSASQRNIAIVWSSLVTLLSIFAYISFVAIDLCRALALSFAVIHSAVRTLIGGHPHTAIPNFGLTRTHMSIVSSFLAYPTTSFRPLVSCLFMVTCNTL